MALIIQNNWPFLQFSKRNQAIADQYMVKVGQPVWSDMSIQKAVKEGYKKSGWVYRAVRLLADATSSVPWSVYTPDGEPIPEHPITLLMTKPNPRVSRQMLFDLMTSWMALTGNAYLIPVRLNGGQNTTELWPVSPDLLKPVPATDPVEWVKGYAYGEGTAVKYQPDEVYHFLFPDPSVPIIGIGPLQAASKAIDVDVEQQSWQQAALQNRGVLDGVFSFKREFKRLEDLEEITEKLNKKFSGKDGKRIAAVGSEATYSRIAATPEEMNALEGRRFTREEIFIIFGIPPQLAGVMEQSTYNNYQVAELIFWLNTVVSYLDNFKDTLNFALAAELGDNVLNYSLAKVPAIRRAQLDRVKSGKFLADMGVPVERINSILDLNIEEYPGWDKSFRASNSTSRESESSKEDE